MKKLNRLDLLLLFLLILYIPCKTNAQGCEDKIWLKYKLPVEERTDALISCMTLEEKVSQMMNDSKKISHLDIEAYDWWNEALHGVARSAPATVFPQAIGLAATFDEKILYKIGSAISTEARAINNELQRQNKPSIRFMGLTFWSPNVNIFRDPRWGRGQETYGEDPFLSGKLGAAFIKGMQGDHPVYLKTAACAKHFAVHSGPEAIRHSFNAVVSEKDLYETYLPAFKACVDANVEAIMCAYNRTNNKPCCGSDDLLQDILRDKWEFKGHIVSDCSAIKHFHVSHQYTSSPVESAALALKSGVNLNCRNTYEYLTDAVKNGLVSEEKIDERLAVLLRTKFRLGLMDPPYVNPYNEITIKEINSPKHIQIARETAQKSIVLLQNKNNLLPLDKNIGSIFIAGPLAADNISLLGNYNGVSPNLVTIQEGIAAKVSPTTRIRYRVGGLLSTPNLKEHFYGGLARTSDVTIAVVGLSVLLEGEEGETIASPEKGDNLSMTLPENQMNMLRDYSKSEKPLIVVVCAGSPIDLTEIKELADAIIYAWYPGEQGGNAAADIIFGDVSPSGRLPITFPKSTDQLPPYEDYSMKGRTYRYMTEEPLYPFGYGLSYTTFQYSNLELNKKSIKKGEPVFLKIDVENTGSVEAEEVVQFYISDVESSVTAPLHSLKGFKRVNLEPGEKKQLTFEITPKMMEIIIESGQAKIEKGAFKITVGGCSPGQGSQQAGIARPVSELFIVK